MLDKQFLGNQNLRTNIDNLIKQNKFPHAVLLTGDTGIGKKSFAQIIAKKLLCQNENNNPCERCPSCLKVHQNICPDVKIITSDKKSAAIGVDVIREVISDSTVMPNENDKKIYIIPDAENMTIQAQNAFLKTLEEPNSFSVFILTTSDTSRLLDTIISRVTPFKLNGVSFDEFSHYFSLKKVSEPQIIEAFNLSKGNIGKGVLMLAPSKDKTQNNYDELSTFCCDFVDNFLSSNEYMCLKLLSSLKGNKTLFADFLIRLSIIFRDALIIKSNPDAVLLQNQKELIKKLAQRLTKAQIMCIINILNNISQNTKKNINENLNLTLLCAQIFSIK